MTNRGVVAALMGALMMVATGCSEECENASDCNDKGSPGEGKAWVCRANACVAEGASSNPTPDSGTPGDGGTRGDGGTPGDAGTPTDAGTPGDMTIAEGGACTTTASCMAGLYCEAQKCQPLHLALTERVTSGSTTKDRAVVVYYKTPGAATPPGSATVLSEDTAGTSRFPRWSKDGTTVAFENKATDNTLALWSRTLPLTAGQKTELATGAVAGTDEFRYMEWAPSANIAWSKTTGNSTSGISYLANATGTVQVGTTAGVFPSWAADGNSFAYSANGQGLKIKSITTGADGAVAGPPTTAEQPLYNRVNNVLLFLSIKDASDTETFGGVSTPLTSLYTFNPPAAGGTAGTPPLIAETRTEGDVTGGTVKSYIFNHTWSPRGTHVAYVRVNYYKPTTGDAVLCNGSNCGGRNGNVLFVRAVDPTTGAPQGDEIQFADEATLPSFSDDGYFLAYVSGSKLQVQKLNPAGTTAATLKDGTPFSHAWGSVQTNRGDDSRPRWQPR
jgi:hypothetical protein